MVGGLSMSLSPQVTSVLFSQLHNLSSADFSLAHRVVFQEGLDLLDPNISCSAPTCLIWEEDRLAGRTKRSGHSEAGHGHPVVFLPKKSETECVPVRRMSSWGFMSFMLAAMNAVINVANNINNNLNNRNNNKNEHNNNQVNTNIGNSGVMQMAMDAAMGGRLFDLAQLDDLRQRLFRKIELDSGDTTMYGKPQEVPTTESPVGTKHSEYQMALLMERLYSAERGEKMDQSKEGLRQKVVELMEKMYEERTSGRKTIHKFDESNFGRGSRNLKHLNMKVSPNQVKPAIDSLLDQAMILASGHIHLWVEAHSSPICRLEEMFCSVNNEAVKMGKTISFLSETISLRSLELLIDDNIVEAASKGQLLFSIKKGLEGKECVGCLK